MKPSVRLLCRYFNDFRFTVPKIYFVKSKGVFWPCRPIARQSTQMLREASEEIFASVRLVLTCLDKALHAQTISTCFSWNKYLLYVYGFFLLLVCDRGAHCQVNNDAVHTITSTSSAYAVENTKIIKEQKDVYRRYNAKEGNSANKNNKNSKDIFMLFVTKHQFSIIVTL